MLGTAHDRIRANYAQQKVLKTRHPRLWLGRCVDCKVRNDFNFPRWRAARVAQSPPLAAILTLLIYPISSSNRCRPVWCIEEPARFSAFESAFFERSMRFERSVPWDLIRVVDTGPRKTPGARNVQGPIPQFLMDHCGIPWPGRIRSADGCGSSFFAP